MHIAVGRVAGLAKSAIVAQEHVDSQEGAF